MHFFTFIIENLPAGVVHNNAVIRECYRSISNSKIEELLIIRLNNHLKCYAVGSDINEVSTFLQNFISGKVPKAAIRTHDYLEGANAVRNFFNFLLIGDKAIPINPKHLLRIKEEFNVALDEDAIGPIITNIYRRGESLTNEFQNDPSITKNLIAYPEVLLDIARKIAGSLEEFQFIFIGEQNSMMEDMVSAVKRIKCKKILLYHRDFSTAYKQSFNLGGIPLDEQQFKASLRFDSVIINFQYAAVELLDVIVPIAKKNKSIFYLFFNLAKPELGKMGSNLSNFFVQTDKEIKRLINLHTDNRRTYLASQDHRIDNEISLFYEWLHSDERFLFENIVSANRRMQSVFELLRRIAPSDISVLITGKTGTGKELIARAIHQNSQRANNRFIAVNCSAIPETLLESELFGYQKGAFTGALVSKKGLIELASGGTLFLDEIGDLPPTIQVKLLRVLQEREILRIGDTTPIKVDIRLLTATNHDLETLTFTGKFRSDLFYRVNTVQINLPPLRERNEDIALLTKYFISKLNQRSEKHISKVSKDVLTIFHSYDWPGNVRELENVIERAFAVSIGEEITVTDLPSRMQFFQQKMIPGNAENSEFQGTLKEFEKERIRDLLLRKNLNIKEVAEILGIGRTTLWRKMKEYNIYKENEKK